MKWLLAALALLACVVLAAAGWLLYTDSGLRWVAALAEEALRGKLRLEGVRGALARDIEFASIRFQDETTRVELRDGMLRLEFLSFLGARAGLRALRAKSLDVALTPGPSDGKPPAPPQIPIGLRVDRADIERISVELGAQRLVLERFELRDAALVQTGAVSATVGFALRYEDYPVSARIKLGGTLRRLDVAFDGRIAEVPAKVRAVVTAFAPRPLAELDAQAGPVDLSRLNRDWPGTALSVKLSGKASSDYALAGSLSARNGNPGPLDKQRIPLTSLDARFAAKDFESAVLQDLRVALSPGGALAGKGALRRGGAELDVQVADLDLRSLRSTLNSTKLSGQVKLAAGAKQTLQGTLSQDDMRITADIVRDGELIEVRSVRAEAQGGAATGSGRLRLSEPMRFEAKLNLEHFDPAKFGQYPGGDINGSFEGTGTLGARPAVDARWVVRDSTLEGEALASQGAARVSGSRAQRIVAQASLGGARLTARGDFGRPGDALGWALEVPSIDYFLGDFSGALRANGTLSGTFEEPRAAFTVEASDLVLPTGMEIKSARAKAAVTSPSTPPSSRRRARAWICRRGYAAAGAERPGGRAKCRRCAIRAPILWSSRRRCRCKPPRAGSSSAGSMRRSPAGASPSPSSPGRAKGSSRAANSMRFRRNGWSRWRASRKTCARASPLTGNGTSPRARSSAEARACAAPPAT
jgi:translocation and assembly module TamB